MTGAAFSALTLIGAPALLTNATSVLLMSTSNRLARSLDRARSLARDLDSDEVRPGKAAKRLRRQVRMADQRVLITVRAMMTLYIAVGAFAASTLAAFLGALAPGRDSLFFGAAISATIGAGIVGFMALVVASLLLVRESQLAYRLLHGETARIAGREEEGADIF